MKICNTCKIEKDKTAFYARKNRPSGITGSCKKCLDKQRDIWRKNNLEKQASFNAKWRAKNPDKTTAKKDPIKNRARTKAWALANPEKVKLQKINWRKNNREKDNADHRLWNRLNPGKKNALTAKRRAAKLKATPKWLTKEHKKEIACYYITAKELQWLSNEPLEVDHIIPLQNKNICGLHVPWNLQILPKSFNKTKSNKF